MKNTRRIFTRALTALAVAAIGAGAWAAPPTAAECGIVGTWSGMDATATTDLAWLGVHSPGSTTAKGAMMMEWIYVDLSAINPAVRLTPGRGAWEQVAKGLYKYTWYAYGLDEFGAPVAMIRVRGTAGNNGCDQIDIEYKFEVFAPLTETMFLPHHFPVDAIPAASTPGYAVQYRVPLVVAP